MSNPVFRWFAGRLIAYCARRRPDEQYVVSSTGAVNMRRFAPFWPDEWQGHNRPPWWRPFNVLVHLWVGDERERMHDHPRWSITVVLRGRIIEHTPWGSKLLTPGCVVIRSRKAIHAFELIPGGRGKTWTMFIVGRRNHRQNYFQVTPFGTTP